MGSPQGTAARITPVIRGFVGFKGGDSHVRQVAAVSSVLCVRVSSLAFLAFPRTRGFRFRMRLGLCELWITFGGISPFLVLFSRSLRTVAYLLFLRAS